MTYITSNAELITVHDALLHAKKVFIDTEFVRKTTFWPKAGLIQISDGEVFFLIDPIAAPEVAALLSKFIKDKKVFVFYSSEQDLEIIYRLTGEFPDVIEDLQVLIAFLGRGEQIGLEAACENFLNINIDKACQDSDWLKRPLSAQQLEYALADIKNISVLYKYLLETYQNLEQFQWYKFYMQHQVREFHPETQLMKLIIKKIKRVKSQDEAKRIQIMVRMREIQAREMDIPRQRVLSDQAIKEISKAELHDARDIRTLAFKFPFKFHKTRLQSSHFNELWRLFQEPDDHLSVPPKIFASSEQQKKIKEISSKMMIPKYRLEKFCEKNPPWLS